MGRGLEHTGLEDRPGHALGQIPGRRRWRRVAVMAVAVVALLSAGGVGAGAAPAVASTPAAAAAAGLLATVPPGPCDPDEVGQTRIGPDGRRYVCVPTGAQGSADGPGYVDEQADQERRDGGRSTVIGPQRPAGVGEDWVARTADNGKGIVWQSPSSTGNADSLRVMNPTDTYANGYARFYNKDGQPIGLDGKPGSRAATHIPMNPDGTYPLPVGW